MQVDSWRHRPNRAALLWDSTPSLPPQYRESSIKLNNISVRSRRPKSVRCRSRTANCGRPGWLASQPFPDVGLASHQLQTRMKSRSIVLARAARGGARGTGRIFVEYLARTNDRTSKTLSRNCGRRRNPVGNIRYLVVLIVSSVYREIARKETNKWNFCYVLQRNVY